MDENAVVETVVAPVVETPVVVAKPVKVAKGHVCSVCGAVIPPTGKRGRPAKVCADCKAKAKPAKAPEPTPSEVAPV